MNEGEYKPITIDHIRSVMDNLAKEYIPTPETIYLTQEEWNSLCEHNPVQTYDGFIMPIGRHTVKIVTAEERETILRLKQLSNDSEKR